MDETADELDPGAHIYQFAGKGNKQTNKLTKQTRLFLKAAQNIYITFRDSNDCFFPQ